MIIDTQNASETTEALLRLIDSFLIKDISVYDSDVICINNVEVAHLDEAKSEVQPKPT